ncbi:von Willebrand factor type A domain-containing protein [Herpetosiphon sp. NSE202]|uniref:YfbK domain-containing protein n=1 Tax=Herpetosiphon sp. NSE202 TaxID=3351349 RepID=UPI00363A0FD3
MRFKRGSIVLIALIISACGGEASVPTSVSDPKLRPAPQAEPTSVAQQPAPQVDPNGGAEQPAPQPIPSQPPADAAGAPLPDVQVIPTQPLDPGRPYSSDQDQEVFDSMYFKNYGTNPFVRTETDPLSTFAMDIDSASYSLMRSSINQNLLPPADSVRVEEYLNAFDYDYPQPEDGDFAIYSEVAPSPFGGPNYELVQIGIQAREIAVADRKPAALTFVIDSSGSMAQDGRLEMVKNALIYLAGKLQPDDSLAIVAFNNDMRVVLQPTTGENQMAIITAINSLEPSGGTNAEAGLRAGFDLAWQAFKPEGINRILMCSDGVANSGMTEPSQLLATFQEYLDAGVQLSTYGVGMGNYNDILLEQLADKGDGNYGYIDSADEAQRLFGEQLTGSLETIGREAKIQVSFDPNVVKRYRLIGYENRDVADSDFRNDSVDGGEIGGGHNVTALYEIKRHPDAQGTIAQVNIRYVDMDTNAPVEESLSISTEQIHSSFDRSSARMHLAASVAEFAELLRHSRWNNGTDILDVLDLAEEAALDLPNNQGAAEFVNLLKQAERMHQ